MCWTRENDRLIAERAEGFSLVSGGEPETVLIDCGDSPNYMPLPHYSTDETASLRAVRAWIMQDRDRREARIYFGRDGYFIELREPLNVIGSCHAPTLAAALAWALMWAIKGEK